MPKTAMRGPGYCFAARDAAPTLVCGSGQRGAAHKLRNRATVGEDNGRHHTKNAMVNTEILPWSNSMEYLHFNCVVCFYRVFSF